MKHDIVMRFSLMGWRNRFLVICCALVGVDIRFPSVEMEKPK